MRLFVTACCLLAVVMMAADAGAQAPDVVHRAIAHGHVASDAVAAERTTTSSRDAYQQYVERAAQLEVQVALRLYDLGEDARATDALRRYQVLRGSDPHAQFLSSLMIGQMMHRNGDHRSAAAELGRASQVAPDRRDGIYAYLMAVQQQCAGLSYWLECRMRLTELAKTPLDPATRELVHYELAYTDVVLRQPVDSELPQRFDDPRLRQQAAGLLQRDADFEKLPRKRAAVAGLLSAVLPGAGQLYNGRPADAALSFVINGGFGVGTALAFVEAGSIPLGIVLAVFTAGFYTGNIVNAVVDARRITADRYLQFFDELESEYWPRVSFVIDEDAVLFTYGFDWPGPSPADHGQREE